MTLASQPQSFTQCSLQPLTGRYWEDDPQVRLLSQQPAPAVRGESAGTWPHPAGNDFIELRLTQSFGPPMMAFVRVSEPKATPAGTMSIEMEWLTTHAKELSAFRGEWLLIAGRELIAHSKDFNEIHQTVEARGITAPFLYYVSTPEEANFIF